GDHPIRIMRSQAAHERDRILIGANDLRLEARHVKVEFGERTAPPSHREMGRELVTLDFDDDLFEQRPEQLLAITRRSRGRIPHSADICSDRKQACALCLGEHAGALLLATRQLSPRGFERAKALLPIALEAAGNQPIVRIDGAIAPLGTACLVARPLDAEPPLLEGCLAIGLKALGSSDRGGKAGRLLRCEGPVRDGFVDLDATDVETITAAPVDKALTTAMVPRSRVSTAIVRTQTTAAVATAGQTLQECAAFSHGATRVTGIIVRPRPRIGGDACL